MNAPEPKLHPNPQFARASWIDLRGPWGFTYDDEDRGLRECWQQRDDVFQRTIEVPYPAESPASGINDPSFHAILWYRRTFEISPDESRGHVVLHFGAVDYRANVWVNGNLVVQHEGGQTPFSADISDALVAGAEQVVVVRAEDVAGDLAQPRGKQDWQEHPHGIWYERTSGIWQPVWIETHPSAYITSVRWTPDVDRGSLAMGVTVAPGEESVIRLRVRLTLHGAVLVDDVLTVYGGEIQREMSLDLGSLTMSREQILWSPGHPNLIDVQLTVLNTDGETLDEVSSYTGLRSTSTQGGRFLLNGRPYYLRMVLDQGYWPQTHLAAPSDEALRQDVLLAKQLGFNGVRIHQKVEDPRFLYWCDRLGLVVWGEMANAYVFNRTSVERTTREWMEVIRRDASHPCIVAWVPLNESWGVPNLLQDPAQQSLVQSLYYLTKTLDPTRPVIANDGWEYLVGDLFGIHDYTFDGDAIRQRYGSTEAIMRTMQEVQPSDRFVTLPGTGRSEVPVALTEFGGISYKPAQGHRWFGYGTVPDTEAFERKYRELVEAVLDCPNLAGFCYTQLTDTAQETNGLLTEMREPKINTAVLQAINRSPSRAVPSDVLTQLRKVTGTSFGAGEFGGESVRSDVDQAGA